MMQLIRKLSECDAYNFSRWLLADAVVCLDGPAQSFSLELCRKTARRAVLQVFGWDSRERCCQSLTVLLLNGDCKYGSMTSRPVKKRASGTTIWQHAFSLGEIQTYLAWSGDMNEIHQGDRPILPGMCLLAALQNQLAVSDLHWRCKFRRPVYLGELCCVRQTHSGMDVYVGEYLVSTIEQLQVEERVYNESDVL